MKLSIAGISYKTTPVELRELFAVTPGAAEPLGHRLRVDGELDEVVVLSTCNRVEVYGATSRPAGDAGDALRLLAPPGCDVPEHWYVHKGPGALAHLFAVASGLDSMALGETQITGQVKTAYQQAHSAGLTGPVLNQAFQKAFGTAKEVRTQTHIGRGATSIGSAAVQITERIFGRRLNGQTVMIVGAGQMGEACVRHLFKRSPKALLLVNRSFEKARALFAECGGTAIAWHDRSGALDQADIVITSTGCPTRLFGRAEVERSMQRRHHRPLVLVDLAVPRNVAPEVKQLENVYLYDIDDLEAIVRENVHQRESELAACRGIIARAVAALWPRLAPRPKPVKETTVSQADGLFADPLAITAT